MARGGLVKVIEEEELRGFAVYDAVFPALRLGQSALTSFRSNFALHGRAVHSALLDATLSVEDPKLAGFRVECNSVTITREFKPLSCVEHGHSRLCKLLYDVTPIVRSKPVKDGVDVVIENFSINTVGLEHVAFLALYSDEKALTSLAYYSGVLLLEPGEHYRLPVVGSAGSVEVVVVAYIPHHNARLVINGRSFGGVGFNTFKTAVGDVTHIELGYEGESNVYPKALPVLSVLALRGYIPSPRLEFDVKRVGEGLAEVTIRNKGDEAGENIIVVSISKGLVIERKVLDAINPGEEKVFTLKVAEGPTTVRIIWRHRGEMNVKEKRV